MTHNKLAWFGCFSKAKRATLGVKAPPCTSITTLYNLQETHHILGFQWKIACLHMKLVMDESDWHYSQVEELSWWYVQTYLRMYYVYVKHAVQSSLLSHAACATINSSIYWGAALRLRANHRNAGSTQSDDPFCALNNNIT